MVLHAQGIDFDLAMTVFKDPSRLDEFNSVVDGEDRWHVIGMAGSALLVLFVVFTERQSDDNETTVRIISARKADPAQRSRYARVP